MTGEPQSTPAKRRELPEHVAKLRAPLQVWEYVGFLQDEVERLNNVLADKQRELAVAYGSGSSPEETEWFSALDRAKEALAKIERLSRPLTADGQGRCEIGTLAEASRIAREALNGRP
jgi:hypothetical protein